MDSNKLSRLHEDNPKIEKYCLEIRTDNPAKRNHEKNKKKIMEKKT